MTDNAKIVDGGGAQARTDTRAARRRGTGGVWAAGLAGVIAVAVTACGGGAATNAAGSQGTGAGGAAAACSPNGTSLQITSQSLAFNKKCLAAPANTPFTITLKNDDNGVAHDVSIYTNSSASDKLFGGQMVTGPGTVTYHVPAQQPGTYFFRCDVHPTQMTGTFVVK
ncbi:MAG: cupredoxin domain-containing protein [Streptosporangiaceae bacterium]